MAARNRLRNDKSPKQFLPVVLVSVGSWNRLTGRRAAASCGQGFRRVARKEGFGVPAAAAAARLTPTKEAAMVEVPRITPEEARAKVQSGQALLVCGYEEPEKFAAMHIEGAISIQEFRKLRPTLSKDQEIIFYCA
jgi:hypothetical protein